ncbi:MAG: type IV secretory system conjugative DNA transfer family protein, partial [Pseudomonadota bacterium]
QNAAVIALTGLAVFEPERCTPAVLWATLTDAHRFRRLMRWCRDSDLLGGDLATLAASFLEKSRANPEHFESHLAGAAAAYAVFKPSSTLGRIGTRHDFDPKTLRDPSRPPVVLFDLIPSDRIAVFAKSNALQQTARLQALKRHREGRPVFFLADEATNLPVPTAVQELELMRSAKLSMALLYQSEASLERVYGRHQAKSIRTNCAEMVFAVADLQTAEEISKRIGDVTVKTASVGFAGQPGQMPSTTLGEAGRRLLPPEDILALDRGAAILLVPGLRPIRLAKLPWFEVEPFKHLAADNPHERHAKSPITRLTLQYGRDATELGAPTIPDLKERRARALAIERQGNRPLRVPWLRLQSFRWVGLVAVVAALIATFGTPHAIIGEAKRDGAWRCHYLGLDGFKTADKQGGCPPVRFLRHWQAPP